MGSRRNFCHTGPVSGIHRRSNISGIWVVHRESDKHPVGEPNVSANWFADRKSNEQPNARD